MLDIFLRKFWKYRKAFGLSFFFFGAPIVYFLRDGIKLAPGSSAFTAVFTLLPLVLVLPKNMFKTLYIPNILAYWLCIIFLFISFIYLIFYCPNAGWFTNQILSSVNIGIIIFLFFILTTVNVNELADVFVPVTFIITVIGCLCVIYYTARNPLALVTTLHGKIGIALGDGKNESTGNSHIFGKGGFAATIAGMILLRNTANGLKKIIILGFTIMGFIIMMMAQSISTILAFALVIIIYGLYNTSLPPIILKTYRMLWNWRFLLLSVFIVIGSLVAWERSTLFNSVLGEGYKNVSGRLEKIIGTLFLGERKGLNADMSANERIKTFEIVKKTLDTNIEKGNILELLLGNGYEKQYVDSPMIQAFNDFGLIGFLLHTMIILVLIKSTLYALYNSKNSFITFIGYTFFLIIVQNFTAGMVIDYPKWCYFALIARFAIPIIYRSKPTFNPSITLKN